MSVKKLVRTEKWLLLAALLFNVLVATPAYAANGESLPGTQPANPLGEKPEPLLSPKERYNKPPLELSYYERVQNLMDSIKLSRDELITINPAIARIALYRTSDKENKQFPPKIYNLIENGLTRKLLDSQRFQIYECMECKSTQLIMKENTFTILRAIESNKRLSEIAQQIKVDGFFVWDLYSEKGRMFLNFKIVAANTGEVVWTRKFDEIFVAPEYEEEKIKLRPYETTFSTGIWGFKYSRPETATGNLVKMDKVGLASFKFMREAKNSPHVIYGIGVDYFTNVVKKDFFNLTGYTLYGHLNLKLDKIFFTGSGYPPEVIEAAKRADDEYFSTFNYYLSVGEAFYMDNHTELYKSGIDIRFSERFSFGAGMVFLPTRDVKMKDVPGYGQIVSFGGLTYDITLGFVF